VPRYGRNYLMNKNPNLRYNFLKNFRNFKTLYSRTLRYSISREYNFFELNYLSLEKENKLFKKIKDILSLNETTLSKQRRIEKLLNVYLIDRESSRIEINPLWENKLFYTFNKEYNRFMSLYPTSIKSLRYNLFSPLDLNDFFNVKLVFFTSIYIFLKVLKETSGSTDVTEVKKSTYISSLVSEFYTILKPNIELYYFGVFSNDILRGRYGEIFKHRKFRYSWSQIQKKSLNVELFNLLKEIEPGLTIYSETYLSTLKEFDKYYNSNLIEIKTFLTQIAEHVFFDLLSSKVFFKLKTFKGGKTYDYVSVFDIGLFNSLDIITFLGNQIPMICPPLDWNLLGLKGGFILNKHNNIGRLTKSLLRGNSSIYYSSYTVNSINIVQSKRYNINKQVLSFVKKELFKSDFGVCSESDLYDLYKTKLDQYDRLKCYFKENDDFNEHWLSYKNSLSSLLSSKSYYNKTVSERKQLIVNLRSDYNITKEFINYLVEYTDIKNKFFKELQMYKHHKFIILFSEIFCNQDLYLVSNLDFRTRFFPVGRGLHRASGLFKYLLFDPSDSFKYDSSSLCYLKMFISLNLFDYKEGFCSKDLISEFDNRILCLDVETHYLDILSLLTHSKGSTALSKLVLNCSEPFLVSLCLYDYFSYMKDNNYISNLSLDFDQCSSGPMIYSLLSNDRSMGYHTNALPKDNNKHDLYYNFLNHLKIKLSSLKIDKDLLTNLVSNFDQIFTRSFSKSIIMPTFYNMGSKGRVSIIRNTLTSFSKDVFAKDTLIKVSNKLSTMISNILKKEYLFTIEYQNSLVEICKVLSSKYPNSSIDIRTLDGSSISYSYLESIIRYGRIYRNKTPYKYRLYSQLGEENKKHSYNHYWSFPPNYIHSLDGAICRIICTIYHKSFCCYLEPLHDSFRIPLNQIDNLKSVIKYVYMFLFFPKFFHKWQLKLTNQGLKKHQSDYSKLIPLYFPELPANLDILKYTFFDRLHTIDSEKLTQKIIDNIKIGVPFTEEEATSFFNSEFMFFF